MTTTTDKTKTQNAAPAFQLPSIQDAAQGLSALNEQLVESSKGAGLKTVDAYEKVVTAIAEFEKKVASDSQVEWVSAIASTHAKALSDMTVSYTTAVRDLLK